MIHAIGITIRFTSSFPGALKHAVCFLLKQLGISFTSTLTATYADETLRKLFGEVDWYPPGGT